MSKEDLKKFKIKTEIQKSDMRHFSTMLRERRLAAYLTVEDVAGYFNINPQDITRLEECDFSVPLEVLIYCLMAYRYILSPIEILPKEPYQDFAYPPMTKDELNELYTKLMKNREQ